MILEGEWSERTERKAFWSLAREAMMDELRGTMNKTPVSRKGGFRVRRVGNGIIF